MYKTNRIKIATWNINSVNARLQNLVRWLKENSPDIIFLQETKTTDFPESEIEKIGYKSYWVPQKSYNGVAILVKNTISGFQLINDKLEGMDNDASARYLEADIEGIKLINIYVPNGNPYPGEKFDYKLEWLNCLYNKIVTLRQKAIPFLIGGDFNIIPEDKDCHDPNLWRDDALFCKDVIAIYRSIMNLGVYDALRVFDNKHGIYSFWDYQGRAYEQNNGIRIDYFLCSPKIADSLVSCQVDPLPRAWEKPSDHVPVVAEICIL